MFARLLPHGEHPLFVHELARMGAPAATAGTAQLLPHCTYKLVDVPGDLATVFIAWLGQHASSCWWYSAPGACVSCIDILLNGPPNFFNSLAEKCRDAALLPLVGVLQQAVARHADPPLALALASLSQEPGRRIAVMGILNVTPDSFSDGGLYFQHDQAMKHAEAMLADGADIIDVGGQSSRPGAPTIPMEVEYGRVIPVVQDIVKRYGARVSVDTYRSRVAAAALDVGATVINDISAMRFDAQMAPLLARRGATVILMHMQGTPQTMQRAPFYHHVIDEVYGFFVERLHDAEAYGIARHRILLDPGFGFGKTVAHNLELLRDLEHFHALGQPLLVGTSRKSFLGRLLQRQVWDRLGGTLATVMYAALHGASVVRVHDVGPVVQALRVLETLDASGMTSLYAQP